MIRFNIQALLGSVVNSDFPITVNFSDADYCKAKADVEKFLSVFRKKEDVRFFLEYWHHGEMIGESRVLRSWYLDHLP